MSIAELMPLLPLLILAGAVLIALFAAAFSRTSGIAFLATLAGLAAAFAALFFRSPDARPTRLLSMDSYSAYYMMLIFASSFGVAVLSRDYFRKKPAERPSEYY